MDFDNAGFLVGRSDRPVDKVLIALDITEEVVKEAVALGAQLIVAHHPVIWGGTKSVTDQSLTGRKLLTMIEHGIAAICAHTNLDAVSEGVNDALAAALELTEVQQLHQDGIDEKGNPYGIGRVGVVNTCSVESFAAFVKQKLGSNGVRYVDGGRPVCRVAVGGGSCSSMIKDAISHGCDTFVTADVKYDGFLDAKAMGINLIDAGHYPTEQVICPILEQWLCARFPELSVCTSKVHREVFDYL